VNGERWSVHRSPIPVHRQASPPSRASLLDKPLIALDLCLRGLDLAREREIVVGGEFARFPLRAKNGVAQPLRGTVGLAASTQHLEAKPPFIEGFLRDPTRPIELRSYTIPKSHSALAVSRF
jgi:hypothetical protein